MFDNAGPILPLFTGELTRREWLRALGLAAAALSFPSCLPKNDGSSSWLAATSPIDRTIPGIAPRKYFGDELDRAHKLLWDKAAVLASAPGKIPEETAGVVVVGGGVSGLFATYLSRDLNPILLEQAGRFGGNAKGQSWNGVEFPLGAAYYEQPDEGSPISRFFTELGLDRICPLAARDHEVILGGSLHHGFWSGKTAGAGGVGVRKMASHLKDVYNSENGLRYPAIPVASSDRAYVERLDRLSLREYMNRAIGPLHPQADGMMEYYCWSAFGGSASEISAAAGLNFFSCEMGNLHATPAGNSAAAEQTLKKILETVPRDRLRVDATVIDVRADEKSVTVRYVGPDGRLAAIRARAAILACPKFVAAKLLEAPEPSRSRAIAGLKYRSYLVANVLLNEKTPRAHAAFLLREKVDRSDIARAYASQGATDMIQTQAAGSRAAALTLFRAIPFDGGRAEVLGAGYDRHRGELEKQAVDTILPALKIPPAAITDVRVSRWGHPLPLAERNLIASGITQTIRQPFRGRVFFVNQDNWMLPAIEVAAEEALHWHPHTRKIAGA